MKSKKYYYFNKEYNEIYVFYRYKDRFYIYQRLLDYINNDPWRFTLYGYYKITSLKALKRELKKINKELKENYKSSGYRLVNKNKPLFQNHIKWLKDTYKSDEQFLKRLKVVEL